MQEVETIPYQKLCTYVSQALIAAGVADDQAELEAEIMAEADLLEVPSHGVRMLPPLLTALREGRVNARPNFQIQREMGAICILDCDNGPGRFASMTAMQAAINRAQSFGVGVCLARNTTHWGRAHAYASHAAQQGFIGICTTNAIPTMAVWGAKKPVIGNNPLAIAVPGVKADEPWVLDMAMSQAAVGKVATWLREGKTPEANWGLDTQGNPTQDAKEILQGAVLPVGGHKGAGMAVMFELMTAALAGGVFSGGILARDASGVDPAASKLFIALNVSAFIEPEEFRAKVAELTAYLAQEAEPFSWPGERGWRAGARNRVEGVPLHKEISGQLQAAGVLPSSL